MKFRPTKKFQNQDRKILYIHQIKCLAKEEMNESRSETPFHQKVLSSLISLFYLYDSYMGGITNIYSYNTYIYPKSSNNSLASFIYDSEWNRYNSRFWLQNFAKHL